MSGGGRAHCGHPRALEVPPSYLTSNQAMFIRFHASMQRVQISNLRLQIAHNTNVCAPASKVIHPAIT